MVTESPYLLEIKKKKKLKDFVWRSEEHDQHVSQSFPSVADSVNHFLSYLVSNKVQRLENFKK